MSTNEGCPVAALIFRFSKHVFSLESIKRSAYKFTDRFAFDFALVDDAIECKAIPIGSAMPSSEQKLFEARFKNEVLDQDLRQHIAEETSQLRNAILAHAFSNSGLNQVEEV